MSGNANFLPVPVTVDGHRTQPIMDSTLPTIQPASYYLAATKRALCKSYTIRKTLYKNAIKKDGQSENASDSNQIFPYSITRRIVTESRLEMILQCPCDICKHYPRNTARSEEESIKAILGSPKVHTSVIILLSMGACFSIQALLENGLLDEDHEIGRLEYIRTRTETLFRDLKNGLSAEHNILPELTVFLKKTIIELQDDLCRAYDYTSSLFRPPEMGRGMCDTLPRNANLPFMNEQSFDETKGYLLHIKKLEIYPEYLANRIQEDMIYKSNKGFVRKKLYMNKISASQDLRRRPDLIIQQEVDLLLFLAQEENHHPRIIKMYFAFKILEGEIETISLMFPQYPGSLEDILHERHTFSFAEFSPDSSVFRNSIINHWLWGEMVELLDGVQFLHDKLLWRNNGNGQAVIMGHFDLKPANILIDHRGHLLITDFGLAQMKAIESQSTQTTGLPGRAGTYSYSAPESAGTELNKLSRSYDVWSMACIILEAAVFILPVKFWEPSQPNKKDKRATTLYTTTNVIGGKFAVETFETHRIAECNSHHKEPCFWLVDGKSKILKQCVNDRLSMLEMSDDIYLSTVGDALREMFLIDPKARRGRPTAEKCRQMLLTNTYMYTQGSEHERELVELCGDHTARPVRKMGVRVSKSYPASSILCTLEISQFRPAGKDPKIRLIMNYQLRGQSSASATGLISDEELIPLRIYGNQNPISSEACKFLSLHEDTTYTFDSATDFYTFQAALTRQLVRGMAGTINQARNPKDGMGPGNFSIPIKQCWLQSAGILNIEPKKFKATGVVQFWQELSVAEHSQLYIAGTPPSWSDTSTCRLTIQLAYTTGILITVDLTSGQAQLRDPNYIHEEGDYAACVALKAARSSFEIGLFGTNGKRTPRTYSTFEPPGVPLDPTVLRERENKSIKWLEVEFESVEARDSFEILYKKIFGS